MGPWVVVERSTNGKTCLVREQERQVTGKQLKELDVPSTREIEKEPWLTLLWRLGRVDLGESALVPQDTILTEVVNCKGDTGGKGGGPIVADQKVEHREERDTVRVARGEERVGGGEETG